MLQQAPGSASAHDEGSLPGYAMFDYLGIVQPLALHVPWKPGLTYFACTATLRQPVPATACAQCSLGQQPTRPACSCTWVLASRSEHALALAFRHSASIFLRRLFSISHTPTFASPLRARSNAAAIKKWMACQLLWPTVALVLLDQAWRPWRCFAGAGPERRVSCDLAQT